MRKSPPLAATEQLQEAHEEESPYRPLAATEQLPEAHEKESLYRLQRPPTQDQYIEDTGSPMPLHNAAGLPDLQVYHSVNYSEGESQYHGQASNQSPPSNESKESRQANEIPLGEEVNSYVWQHAKSKRKKKPLTTGKTQAPPHPIQEAGYQQRTLPQEFFQALAIDIPDTSKD